ncbi:MAG: hypothetical protein QNJ70_12415 [Xenococcaceae cyanobacterium MO_207.B15]|nr:hypothetical protein [Xenococcaceae cyanobacterium MO_207.B15]
MTIAKLGEKYQILVAKDVREPLHLKPSDQLVRSRCRDNGDRHRYDI